MATLSISIVGFLALVIILALFASVFLFGVQKNAWHLKYQLHRPSWLPDGWCGPCVTAWLSLIPVVIIVLLTGAWWLIFAPLCVPTLAIIIFKAFLGNQPEPGTPVSNPQPEIEDNGVDQK